MTEYIYIVKCDGCEDEMFNFFTDARMQCDLVMSKHPIITQVEVERNDFGECTDSHDLGTVWSWEEMMKDTETNAEPAKSIFTKDDFVAFEGDYNPENDPEFYELDNSVEFEPEISEVSAIDEVPDNFRKPIPEGMTIEQLIEEMEENEDTVECVGCEELFPKDECSHKDDIGWLCGNCEDRIVECSWCDDLFDKSECRYEVDLGWLCDRCEAAIKSRGETLTFREGSYWDFLDESAAIEDSPNVGKFARLVYNEANKYHNVGDTYQLLDLKALLKSSRIHDLTTTGINLIAKFDNNCKVIQETDKAYLLNIPCYYRSQPDRSKFEEQPRYVRCWVPKAQVEIIED